MKMGWFFFPFYFAQKRLLTWQLQLEDVVLRKSSANNCQGNVPFLGIINSNFILLFFCLFVLLQFTANCTVFVKGDQISQGQSMELLQNLDIFLLIFFFFQFM